MNDKLLELLKTVEELEENELNYLYVWIEYNQRKKEVLEAPAQSE